VSGPSPESVPAWCRSHWEPYREGRANGVLATALLAQAMVENAAFMLEARVLYGRPTGPVPTDVMNTVLKRHAPMCCYLGQVVVDGILREATA